MPETDRKRSTEHGVEAFPNDVRHLKDFPLYDSSLLDGPLFRQKLHTWASRTEKVSIVCQCCTLLSSSALHKGRRGIEPLVVCFQRVSLDWPQTL